MGGMKKGAGKKPGQILVEALLEWQRKESEWVREGVCLEHSVATARGYLARINEEKDAIADAIERAVEDRRGRSVRSDAYRASRRTASRGVAVEIDEQAKHREMQRRMIAELRRERGALEGAAAARRIEVDATAHAPAAESLARLEERLAELHARVAHLRGVEAAAAAKARDLATAAAHVTVEALLNAPSSVVVVGSPRAGPAATLFEHAMCSEPTGREIAGGVVHVLGAPTSPLDSDHSHGGISGDATSGSVAAAIEAAKHNRRVTRLCPGESASRHIARVLREMVANAPEVAAADGDRQQHHGPTRLLVVTGRLVPGQNGILQLRTDASSSGGGGAANMPPPTLSLHDLLEITRGTDIAVAIDALAPGPRGYRGYSILQVPGAPAARCWRHRQELPSAHAEATRSCDGPLALLVGLALAAGHAVDAGVPDRGTEASASSSSAAATTTVGGLAVRPATFVEAIAVLAGRATASRELEPLEHRRDWPAWVPADIGTAVAVSSDNDDNDESGTEDAKQSDSENGADSNAARVAAMPLCDRALLAAVGVATGATVAFPVRQRLREWALLNDAAMRVVDVTVRARVEMSGEQAAARALQDVLAGLDAAPLRWVIGHVDSRRLAADTVAELLLDQSTPPPLLVAVPRLPDGATEEDFGTALTTALARTPGFERCRVEVASTVLTHAAAGGAAAYRVLGATVGAGSDERVSTAVKDLLGPMAAETASVVLSREWPVRLRLSMGAALALLVQLNRSAVPLSDAVAITDFAAPATQQQFPPERLLPSPVCVPADRLGGVLEAAKVSSATPERIQVLLRHTAFTPTMRRRVEDAFAALAREGTLSAAALATAFVAVVPVAPTSTTRAFEGHETSPTRQRASRPRTGGLNAPRDGVEAAALPRLEVAVGPAVRAAADWTTSVADAEGFTADAIVAAVREALRNTPLVL